MLLIWFDERYWKLVTSPLHDRVNTRLFYRIWCSAAWRSLPVFWYFSCQRPSIENYPIHLTKLNKLKGINAIEWRHGRKWISHSRWINLRFSQVFYVKMYINFNIFVVVFNDNRFALYTLLWYVICLHVIFVYICSFFSHLRIRYDLSSFFFSFTNLICTYNIIILLLTYWIIY